jgi:RNA polymerase sigma-70 factor (ECF subfamily)
MASYRELTENYIATRSHEDYTALYRKVKPGLQNYIKNIIKDGDIAEDIAVNTLIKMWTKIDQYDPQYQITTWLYRIAYNESLYYIRERNRKTSIDRLRDEYGVEVTNMSNTRALEELIDDAAYKSESDWYEEENELNDTYENALKAIRDLKPLYKDILVDRLIGNMKYEDIAKKHDLPLQTIKNRIRRGRSLIVEAIGVDVNF